VVIDEVRIFVVDGDGVEVLHELALRVLPEPARVGPGAELVFTTIDDRVIQILRGPRRRVAMKDGGRAADPARYRRSTGRQGHRRQRGHEQGSTTDHGGL